MNADLNNQLNFETWCYPHEAAQLTNPYLAIGYGYVRQKDLRSVAACAIDLFLREQSRRLAGEWDRADIVVGLA